MPLVLLRGKLSAMSTLFILCATMPTLARLRSDAAGVFFSLVV